MSDMQNSDNDNETLSVDIEPFETAGSAVGAIVVELVVVSFDDIVEFSPFMIGVTKIVVGVS
jgi:hypothetical protein